MRTHAIVNGDVEALADDEESPNISQDPQTEVDICTYNEDSLVIKYYISHTVSFASHSQQLRWQGHHKQ